ncbi:MAG: helix-turn-helix domain-containing protein [Deltaproteobacteria bacterium]|nr:helix-turn-helix domain-containing protein [Deltaproteobacteria bacterium]
MLPPRDKAWLRAKSVALLCDVSERTVRDWLKAGLPHSRVGGAVLVNRDQLDEWLLGYAVDAGEGVNEIVNEVMAGLS